MRSEQEIKQKIFQCKRNKFHAERRGDDTSHRLYSKFIKILNWIIKEE